MEETIYMRYAYLLPEYDVYKKRKGPLDFGRWILVKKKISEGALKDVKIIDELLGITKEKGDEPVVLGCTNLKYRDFLICDANAEENSRYPLSGIECLSLEEQGYTRNENGDLIDRDGDICFPDDGSKVEGFKETVRKLAPYFMKALDG